MDVAEVLAQYPVLRPGVSRTGFVLTEDDMRQAIEEDLKE